MRNIRVFVAGKKFTYGAVAIVFLLMIIFITKAGMHFPGKTAESNSKAITANPTVLPGLSNTPVPGGKLAIIIDDFGQPRAGVKEMMDIRRHLTFAVMPFLEFSKSDAELANKKGHEVIVHLPMEPYGGNLGWVGPKPILTCLADDEVRKLTEDALNDVPHAVGANVHMGSKASGDERIMTDILDVVKAKGLFFVDSKTSANGICRKIADLKGVQCLARDVFLDGKQPKSFVKERLNKAGETALKKGSAIAIGHVGTEGGKITAEAISEMLENFDKKNIELVYVSELLK